MKITYPIRNNFIRVLLILITGLAGSCLAQDYPSRPIKMIMPFAPGGAGDFIGRILSAKMSEVLGQQVFIENKPGLGGNVGLTLGAKSPPDGYTIVYANIGAVAINPALYTNLNINPLKDFTPITLIADVPSAFVGNADFPPKNVTELITYLRSNPNKFNFASPGGGSANRLESEIFMQITGTKMVHVPYKGGGGQAAIGLIGGDAQVMFNTLPSVKQFILSGRVKGYAVTSATRQLDLPNVPTFLELGFPDLVTGSWQGILVPSNTPIPIVNKLFVTITQILEMPDIKERLAGGGVNVMISKSPEAARQFIQAEIQRWGKVVKDSGTTPD
jgi:tripartite-type tricarboxylate transporter receptor subunit TctC